MTKPHHAEDCHWYDARCDTHPDAGTCTCGAVPREIGPGMRIRRMGKSPLEEAKAELEVYRAALDKILLVTDREHRERFVMQGPRAAMLLVHIAQDAVNKYPRHKP